MSDDAKDSEESPTFPDVNQSNMFDVRDKELKASGKRTWLHRLYLIASLDLRHQEPDDIQRRASVIRSELDEFGAECEHQIRRLYNSYREETASGFLLIYPKFMVHVLESSEDTIVAYLRDLRKTREQPESKLLDAKVLLISHNIPERLFDAWSFRSLVAPSREQIDPGLSRLKAATGCLGQLLGLAAHLRKAPKANLKNAMDLLSERVPDLLPTEDLLAFLLNEDVYLSVEEFLDLYYSELSFVEEGELVWPLPAHVYPYTN